MPKGIFVVQSSPLDAAAEAAYQTWYSNERTPDVLDVPGLVSSRRFRIVAGPADAHTFLTVCEVDAGDVRAPSQEVFRRTQPKETFMPDHLGSAGRPTTTLYELTGDNRAAR